jgi:hypothetical protein
VGGDFMPDKYLESLVNASKAGLEARQADIQKEGEAIERENIQGGRRAARSDYEKWRSAIEGEIGQSFYNGSGTLTLKFDSEAISRNSSMLYGYRKTIFGKYKSHFYYLSGFTEVCKSTWIEGGIRGYVSELQEMLGKTFKVSGDSGGYRTYNDYYAGIEHADGSTSSMYRTESYNAAPSVRVNW